MEQDEINVGDNMPPAKGWPLSQDELKKARDNLLPSMCFHDVAAKYISKIEESSSSSFTHKCTCPNSRHKNGQERTPSFHFSEQEKRFVCFGCSINGDIFDFIAMMEGMPWYEVVRGVLNNQTLDSSIIGSSQERKNFKAFSTNLFETNLKISTELRDYLKPHVGKSSYRDEVVWVEAMFKKLDSHLDKITIDNGEVLVELRMQMEMEIERRKLRSSINSMEIA